MLRLVLSILVLALSAGTLQAQDRPTGDLSQPGDYDIAHTGWNGLSTLSALAQGSGLQVIQEQVIDWEELDSNDLLVLLYPTSQLDANHVTDFIRNGGRVLIADDYGTGSSLFSKLGGLRSDAVVNADMYHDNQSFAPIARPSGRHELSQNVFELTSNHPSTIRNLQGMESVFEFNGGASLVAAGSIGVGRYVALADPSILINRMLQFEGNLQFSINLLRYLTRPGESDRLIILSGGITMSGVPRNRYDDGSWRGGTSASVATLNSWLDDLNRWLFTGHSLRVVTVILALVLSALAFLTLPNIRHSPLDGSWTKPGEETPVLTEVFEGAGSRVNFLLPAAIQRDNINTALEFALATPDALYQLSDADLFSRVASEVGRAPARLLRQMLPDLRQIPERAQAASYWEPTFMGRSEFEVFHNNSTLLFEQLESSANKT